MTKTFLASLLIDFSTVGITYLISGFGRRNTQPRPFPSKLLKQAAFMEHMFALLSGLCPQLFFPPLSLDGSPTSSTICYRMFLCLRGSPNTSFLHIWALTQEL